MVSSIGNLGINPELNVGSGKYKTANYYFQEDSSGNLGIYNSSGIEIAYFDTNGSIHLPNQSSYPSTTQFQSMTDTVIGRSSNNNGDLLFALRSSQQLIFYHGTNISLFLNGSFIWLNQKVTKYMGISTAGLGVPAIYAEEDLTAQTASVSSIVTYTPSANGTFEISGYIDLISIAGGTSPNVNLEVSYTDINGNSKATVLSGNSYNSGIVSGNTDSIGTAGDSLALFTMPIRVKANTAITIHSQVNGSPTSISYNVGAYIKQIA